MRGQGNNQRHSHDSRVYIYSEHVPDRMLQRVDHLLMIRDRRYKLVEYVGMGAGQLFDLHEDPDELHDLWNSPAQTRHSRRDERAVAALVCHQHYRRRRLVEGPRGG